MCRNKFLVISQKRIYKKYIYYKRDFYIKIEVSNYYFLFIQYFYVKINGVIQFLLLIFLQSIEIEKTSW